MNIHELFEEIGTPIAPDGHHHSTDGWIQLQCPWCETGEAFHLGYNLQYGNLNCWRCGSHSLLEYLVTVTGNSWDACKEILGSLDRVKLPKIVIEKGKLHLPKGIGKLKKAHKAYLQRRGFDPKAITRLWKIGGFTWHKRFAWRLFIPIHFQNEVVSFTTRAIRREEEPRYLSAKRQEEAMSHKQLLYGEDMVRYAIIVTEGPLDVWRIGPGAVSTFGMSFNQQQVQRIVKYPLRAICFDAEKEAQKRAGKLADLIEPFPGRTLMIELEGKDAADSSEKEILKLRQRVFGN